MASGAVFSDTIGGSGACRFVVPAGTYTVTATVFLNDTNRTYGNVCRDSQHLGFGDEPVLERVFATAETGLHEPVDLTGNSDAYAEIDKSPDR